MKKLILTATVLFFLSTISYAQSKNDLKGPKAKNYKVWKKDKKTVPVYTTANRKSLLGPKAKNKKPGTAKGEKVLVIRDDKKSSAKGPAAKNYKPWK